MWVLLNSGGLLGRGIQISDFAAIAAARVFLRALQTRRDSEFSKDSVVMDQLEETVIEF